jgi:hypothetical protein
MKDRCRGSRHPDRLDGQSGQVEAETAIVLPVMVFLLLGLIQMGLLNQAGIFAKYAAYRAVRTGALRNGKVELMERAAVAAALPILSWGKSHTEVLGRTDTATNWLKKWGMHGFMLNRMIDFPVLKYAEVTICGPTQREVSGGTYNPGKNLAAFDNIETSSKGIHTKLRIRLVLNYRMIVPFANWVIHRMWRGERITKELHLDARSIAIPSMDKKFVDHYALYVTAAKTKDIFIIPIKAYYSMKMHSDIPVELLPDSDDACGKGKI